MKIKITIEAEVFFENASVPGGKQLDYGDLETWIREAKERLGNNRNGIHDKQMQFHFVSVHKGELT